MSDLQQLVFFLLFLSVLGCCFLAASRGKNSMLVLFFLHCTIGRASGRRGRSMYNSSLHSLLHAPVGSHSGGGRNSGRGEPSLLGLASASPSSCVACLAAVLACLMYACVLWPRVSVLFVPHLSPFSSARRKRRSSCHVWCCWPYHTGLFCRCCLSLASRYPQCKESKE